MVDLRDLEGSIVEIYNQHYLDVYRFLVCFSGNQNDAEDLTQEVFIRVLKSLPNFKTDSNFKTWIFSIAKHVALDHYRKKKFSTIFKEGFFSKLESKEKKPDEEYEKTELEHYVHEAISKLKPNHRAAVILRGINEFSVKETAEILQCSEAKVKVDYHRALKDLKRKLDLDGKEVLSNAK
ncbi:RNA polymerase sigma factor [Ureibacillus chungkukjangi]|uniref:RNA polymerase sigma factor n=1 Tax=Ureibacillus chungkukjangi TaxID=1202712 RepID=A0A318TNH9_9BACL|nr:RNA polymerase sigma factor [Ureibacillus chungkukjangi]MCM3387875.1 RNA polymerase sigma factor [Ureibacillus chungkukjangi]PYF03435.1 RNA polymerase sigma-70 factor (ECF subfamily) [Ureibacillus chungkukjangi]